MGTSAIFGEEYTSKVGAVFADGERARAAAASVMRSTGIDPAQIRVLEPGDPRMERKLEPESSGIARTLVKAHVTLGTAGLVLGISIALLVTVLEIDPFASNPWYTLLVAGFFGAVAGLLLGGLVALRPDHDRLIASARKSGREGRWFVLVHASDRAEERRAETALGKVSEHVVRTL